MRIEEVLLDAIVAKVEPYCSELHATKGRVLKVLQRLFDGTTPKPDTRYIIGIPWSRRDLKRHWASSVHQKVKNRKSVLPNDLAAATFDPFRTTKSTGSEMHEKGKRGSRFVQMGSHPWDAFPVEVEPFYNVAHEASLSSDLRVSQDSIDVGGFALIGPEISQGDLYSLSHSTSVVIDPSCESEGPSHRGLGIGTERTPEPCSKVPFGSAIPELVANIESSNRVAVPVDFGGSTCHNQ